MISARDFGAVGDGISDDRDSIQRALTAGAGQEVLVPNGRYLVGQHTGQFWCLNAPAGTTLRGESRDGAVLVQSPGVGTSVQLLQVEAPDVTVKTITLDGDKAAQSVDPHRAGVFGTRAPRLTLRSVTLRNFTGDGAEIYNGSNDPDVFDVLATGNDRNGITLGGGTEGGMFRSSQFIGNGAQQFDSEGGLPINNVTLTGCLFDGRGMSGDFVLTVAGHGADIRNSGWTVAGNVINGSTLVVWASDVVIANNTGTNPTAKASVFIYRTCDRIRVLGNDFQMTGPIDEMVYVTGTNPGQAPGGVLIEGNKFATSKAAYGVVAQCVRDLRVIDNEFIGAGIAKSNEAGIYVRTTRELEPVRSAIIQRNKISDFGDYGVMLAGNGAAQILKAEITNNTFASKAGTMKTALYLDDGTHAARDVTICGNTLGDGTTTMVENPPAGVSSPWGDGTRWVMP